RSVAAAIDGCVNEQLAQLVIVAGEVVGHVFDLADVSRGVGRSQTHGAKHFLCLAAGESATVGQFLAHALGAVAGAAAGAPAEVGIRAFAPVVVPAVVFGNEAVREVVGIDQVLRLYHAGGVDQLTGLGAFLAAPVVISKRLRERVHAVMATNAAVQEDTAVATRTAADVLANAIGGACQVLELLKVIAQVMHQRKTQHRTVGPGDK